MLKIIVPLAIICVLALVTVIYIHSRGFSNKKIISNKQENNPKANTLVVLLHSFSNGSETLNGIRKEIENHYGDGAVDFIQPDMPLGSMSVVTPERVLAELLAEIDSRWNSRSAGKNPYNKVIFVGHSYGALLARKLYVIGMGETPDAPFEQSLKKEVKELELMPITVQRPWANHVERLVLMAGMNRGWTISHHLSPLRSIVMRSGVALGWLIELVSGKVPVILEIRKGAPFITQLRLQWLAMESNRENTGSPHGASVVQLLGTIDDLVSPEDNIDLATGRNFTYFEVPFSGHGNVIDMDGSSEEALARAEVFSKALSGEKGDEKLVLDIYGQLEIDKLVKDVVFVIHGIRDRGYWTKKIVMRIQKIASAEYGNEYRLASETSSYGYFPMLSFLNPGARQKKVAWLMDKYTEAKALYPNARFHFVGHSNGTYLLSKALQDYESVRFDHVAFAGSVVKTDYGWDQLIKTNRVKAVYNFRATSDWVVALFPKSLQLIGWQDLGSAGHDGFIQAGKTANLYESKYVIGGHSAALDERIWNVIADFILTGEAVEPEQSLVRNEPVHWLDNLSKIAWIVPLTIISILSFVLYFLIKANSGGGLSIVYIFLYLYSIWLVITRV